MDKEKEGSRLIEFLLNPSSYPHKPRYVKHVQTHASHVFIVPPYVYKIKKPVNFGFLDFSTLDKRKYYCEKEVELNSLIILRRHEKFGLKNSKALKIGRGRKETVEYTVK